jgi:uncharacterized membrane protein
MTASDKIMEAIGWLMLLLLWVYNAYLYNILPQTIPVHFDAAGKADGFGDKITLFLMPTVGTIIMIGITILNRYPHVFNYPLEITEENALHQYRLSTRFIRQLKISVLLVFWLISLQTRQTALGYTDGLGTFIMIFSVVAVLLPTLLYVISAKKEQ